MKRRFTLIITALMLMITSFAWGQTRDEVVAYTLDGTITGGSSGYATESEITQNGMTWMVTGNTQMNPWRIGGKNLNGVDRPLYSTSAMSDNITKVVITNGSATATVNSMTLYVSSSADFSNPTTVAGSFSAGSTTTFERPAAADWTSKYFKLVYNITTGSSNQYAQLVKAEFYKENGGQQTVSTPTFSPVAGTYTEAQSVTMSCTTEGATIYYTTDGTTPVYEATGINGTQYTSPIAISETTTVKAIAVKTGMNNSSVATAVYTIQTPVTIAEARQAQTGSVVMTSGIVTSRVGTTAYIQDNTAAICVYGNSTLVVGHQIIVSGTLALYNGLLEITNPNIISDVEATAIQPEHMTVAQITASTNQGWFIRVEGATVTAIAGQNTTIEQGESNIVVRGITSGAVAVGDVISLNGNIGCYNNANQIANPTDVTVMEQVADPTFSPEAGSYIGAQNVTISCETEGATIYYTLDGTTPTANSTVYSASFEITESITIKAMAAKEGMLDSEVVTAVYTIEEPQPTYYSVSVAEGITDGTVSVNPTSAAENDTITVTATPANNYELATLTYTYAGVATPIDIDQTTMKFIMPAADVTVNATFTEVAPPTQETDYTLITNANALIAGDKYIVVGIKGENYKALGKQANNNRQSVDVTPDENVITLTPATTNDGGVFELTLGQDGDYWTLYDAVNQGYLYAASSSANYLKVQATNDANGQWTIDIANNGVATIKAQGTNTRNWLRLNNNGSPFSCYASGQLDVYLYKAGEVPTPPTPTNYTVSVADGITNGTVTVNPTSAAENDTIAVTATPANNYELATLTYTYAGVATPIDIDQTTMKFIMPAADVTVNATFSELATVATPTFTPAAGSYISVQTVSLACATDGASIYYTLDGTDPTTESTVYAEAFTVSTTTTVKAMAVKEGMNNSAIASVTYTIIEPMTIAAARALENNQYALVQGVVTFIDGRNIYVQDATAGIDLYLNNNTVPSTLAIGDMVKGYGKKTVYNGLTELTAINGGDENQFLVLSSGNPLPVAVKTIAEILEDHAGDKMLQSTRVQIVEATVGTINNSNNTPISQGDNTLNIYKLPVVEGLLEGDIVTVTGIVGCYNNPQLRVASAADVTFTHPSGITITPSALSGFNYVYEEGPSTVKTFVISGMNLSAPTYIHASENYEISSFPGESFYPESTITINTYTGVYNYTIKVRLKAGLEVGDYNESIMICEDEVDTLYVALSGNVTNTPPQPQGDYTRLTDLSLLTSGSKVIFAARYNETANEYYAMTAQASGKPEGVLFTSETTNGEVLPAEIVNAEETYYWTVDVNGANYTFTNANGDVLGYTSGTNFATGGDNTAWAITYQTSEASAMVPNYSAFVINNVNNAVRAIALNSNHNFGPYHTQNMGADNYNFFLDMFATVGGGTLTCATPTFTPEAGTYFETQEVAIACNTADATIYYTTDGTEPDETSSVYTEPITVAESMTFKAIAMKEGYENSNIATAEYTIILGAVTIFSQDWEGDMNGWTFVTVEGGNAWTIAQYSGNHYAYANGYNGGVNEQWCISPAFDLNVYSNASLSFRNAKNYNGPDMQLYFSNNYDGENPASATWTELEFNKSTGSYAWAESGSIDLADFTGDECYIGFKYTSTETEAAAWEIDDVTLMGFTTEPYLTVAPNALSGFSYIVGNGPSAAQTFTVSGGNLPPAPGGTSGGVNISISNSNFELSLDGEVYSNNLSIEVVGTLEPTTVYVRLEAGLPVYEYIGMIFIEDGGTTVSVSVIGNVIEEPVPGGDWNRIYALTDLHDGDQVILAARYDATVGNGYYAMPAVVSGKPDGVLFTSVDNGGVEQLPAEISDDADTYLWNVTLDGDVITLVNAAGDSLGYSSSTNFAGNTNTEWNIALQTSEEGAMIPNYTGFVITNGTTTNRGIAKNASHKFGAYAVSNMTSADYNFFLDLFVYGGSVTPTVATPVFSMASGTYYEAIEVEITCSTEGATIYYTLDGTDPTAESEVYTEALVIEETTTIKAIAMKEGYDNSGIATANYVIMNNIEVIVSQDWEGEMNGWTFVTVEGNKPWTIGSYSGNHYANANGYNDDVDNEQWCISPAFNLSGRTDHNVTLTFRNAMKFTGPALELYFANDYDGEDPTSADWQPLSFTMSEGNYTWTESGEISLNAFDGEQCYIGFRYLSTIEEGAASWEVDDILIVADMGTDPYLSATPNALSGFVQNLGEPSEAQTFVLTGGNLPTGFLTLTVNNGFEISFDGELYSGVSITIPVDNPTLEPITIYVRLNGEEIGDYEGAIIIDVNDDVTTTVSVRGTVTGDGIDETLASTVSVWNNNNELMIANDGNEELIVVVYNLIGQPVLSETVATGTNAIRHDLVEGVYIVRIANGKEMTGIKVVVRR